MQISPIEHVSPYISSIDTKSKQTADAIEISRSYIKGEFTKEFAFKCLERTLRIDDRDDSNFYPDRNDPLRPLIRHIQITLGSNDVGVEPVASERGGSENPSFWVIKNTTREKLLFLKTFAANEEAFLEEVFGLEFLGNVVGISSPDIRLLSRCYIGDQPYYLLFEGIVKGFSIQEFYNRVAQYLIGTDERSREFKTLCHGVYACGFALAKLHAQSGCTYNSLHEQVEDDILNKLYKAIAQLEINPIQGLEIEQLKVSVSKVLDKMKNELHLTGVTHGDMKIIHTFYDPETHDVSFIDPQTLAKGLDRQGNPTGLPSMEYLRFVLSLRLNRTGYSIDADNMVCRRELLTEEEEMIVEDYFLNGYVASGGELPTAAEEDLALLRHNLSFIANANRILPEPDLTRLNDLVSFSANCLRERLISDKTDHLNKWYTPGMEANIGFRN